MIGPPDVDHRVEAAPHFVAVIGDVGSKIGPRAVRLFEWPINFVAERSGAEQGLRARLPIIGQLTLRGLQHTGIYEPPVGQNPKAVVYSPTLGQAALGHEEIMIDAEQGQIVAD